jgi:methionine sulfoxide reductase heme-binding subunit
VDRISPLSKWLCSVLLFNTVIVLIALSLASESEPLKLWTVYSARLAFVYFFCSFSISSICVFLSNSVTRYLRRNRRYIGLSFALAHAIHLIVLTSYLLAIDYFPGWIVIIFGGLGYVMIFLMAITSNDQSVQLVGLQRWTWLHKGGVYYIALIFTYIYLLRVLSGEHVLISSFFLFTILAVYILRIVSFLKLRKVS